MGKSDGEIRAFKIIEAYVESRPDKADLLENFGPALSDVGNAALNNQDIVAARYAYQTDCEINEIILNAEPENKEWRRRLSISYENLGDLARETSAFSKGKKYFERSISFLPDLEDSDEEELEEAITLYSKLLFVTLMGDDKKSTLGVITDTLKLLRGIERRQSLSLAHREFLVLLQKLQRS